ncbi:MAG: lipoyl synthase, partial [Thermoleophilia bacterium]|nr:lipoyl synthase [Thermoleophilia bacterium]
MVHGRLIGEGPAEALEPVRVEAGHVAQLCDRRRLPRWVAAKNPLSGGFVRTKALMREKELVTVCEEAACPNIGRCWVRGTATFMICGEVCTRGCRFCNVATARPAGPPDPEEPGRVAEAAARMGLRFVVITAVARDDLPDGGAAHFAACVAAVRERMPDCRVEVLIPDLRGRWEA